MSHSVTARTEIAALRDKRYSQKQRTCVCLIELLARTEVTQRNIDSPQNEREESEYPSTTEQRYSGATEQSAAGTWHVAWRQEGPGRSSTIGQVGEHLR